MGFCHKAPCALTEGVWSSWPWHSTWTWVCAINRALEAEGLPGEPHSLSLQGLWKEPYWVKNLQSWGVTSHFPLLCSLFSPSLSPSPAPAKCLLLAHTHLLTSDSASDTFLSYSKASVSPSKFFSQESFAPRSPMLFVPSWEQKPKRKSPMCPWLPGEGQCRLYTCLTLSDVLKASPEAILCAFHKMLLNTECRWCTTLFLIQCVFS